MIDVASIIYHFSQKHIGPDLSSRKSLLLSFRLEGTMVLLFRLSICICTSSAVTGFMLWHCHVLFTCGGFGLWNREDCVIFIMYIMTMFLVYQYVINEWSRDCHCWLWMSCLTSKMCQGIITCVRYFENLLIGRKKG